MRFNTHTRISGQHAFLSPSSPSWLNYDLDKLDAAFRSRVEAQRGTELHHIAELLIRNRIRVDPNDLQHKTIALYVNDAIDLRMEPEVTFTYSDNCFGTADAARFTANTLRIHDLKNGVTPAKKEQLEIYTALFCLEYDFKPRNIKIVLRLYQNDAIYEWEPEPTVIMRIMAHIVYLDERLNYLREVD